MSEGWRLLSRLMLETPEGKDLRAINVSNLMHQTSLSARAFGWGLTGSHFAGTASMGSVVDGSWKVRRRRGLRVVDASVESE